MARPIDADDWPVLLDAVRRARIAGSDKDVSDRHLMGVLAAPAAVAFWMSRVCPCLLEKPALELLVVGAAAVDAVDQGRWYDVIHALAGAPGHVTARLVGEELEGRFASPLARMAPNMAAQLDVMPLDAWLKSYPSACPDVAVIFHPGFQKNRSWLEDGSLAALLERGVHVMVASFEHDEYEMDSWVAESYGLAASPDVAMNPFFLDIGTPQSPARWARALWSLRRGETLAPPATAMRMAALDELTAMSMHSHLHTSMAVPPPGFLTQLTRPDGVGLSYIHVFDGFFADPTGGELWRLTDDGRLTGAGRLPPSELASYPRNAVRNIDRAVWAAGVKRRYLLRDVPVTAAAPAAAADLKREMIARAMRYFAS